MSTQMEQPEYHEDRKTAYGEYVLRQRAVGLTLKHWVASFWCQTILETVNGNPLFAFAERVPEPGFDGWTGNFVPLAERLFERGSRFMDYVVDGTMSQEPWAGGWIPYTLETRLQDLDPEPRPRKFQFESDPWFA